MSWGKLRIFYTVSLAILPNILHMWCRIVNKMILFTARSISIGPLFTQIDISDIQHLTAELIVK